MHWLLNAKTSPKNNAGNELLCWFVTSTDARGECILVGSVVQLRCFMLFQLKYWLHNCTAELNSFLYVLMGSTGHWQALWMTILMVTSLKKWSNLRYYNYPFLYYNARMLLGGSLVWPLIFFVYFTLYLYIICILVSP